MLDLILWAHFLTTIASIGLIWFVQIVHYPLFLKVGELNFKEYEVSHQSRTSIVVAPLMLTELATGLLLVLQRPSFITIESSIAGFSLLLIIWFSTFLWQVPLHQKLSKGYDTALIQQLIRSNWIRTLAWTARGCITLNMVLSKN